MLVDDHELSRAGLRSLLAGEDGFVVVAEATSISEAARLLPRARPHLILLDVRLPDGDGIDAIPRIRELAPTAQIVILTIYGDSEMLLAARKAGANAFVHKSVSRAEFLSTLHACMAPGGSRESRGYTFLGHTAAEPAPDLTARFRRLTPREREVSYHIAHGLSNAEIGEKLGLKAGTVKVNVEKLLGKMGLANRTQLAIAVHRHGIERLLQSITSTRNSKA